MNGKCTGILMKNKLRLAYEIGSAIDPGRKRKGKANQDALVVLLPPKGQNTPPVLVIADGMGGYAGGQIASQIVTQKFSDQYASYKGDDFLFEDFVTVAIEVSLKEMQRRAEIDPDLANMGSTVVTVSIFGGMARVANVGDSRAYLVHEGEMHQINYDHSFVAEAVRAGLLTPLEAMQHPKKNQLTQSISSRRPNVNPYFGKTPFSDNDLVILCSDGLWGVVPEALIQAVVTELPPQQAAEKLVRLANTRGGPDNISVIVCKKAGAKLVNPFIHPEEKVSKKKIWSFLQRTEKR